MARIRKSEFAYDAFTIEGSLISPAKLAEVALRKAEKQSEADYLIPRGLTLRDELARYFRIGQALYRDLFANPAPGFTATTRFAHALLRDVFGFSSITEFREPHIHDGRNFPITLEALSGRVPVVVAPPADDLDHASVHLSRDRRRSAFSAVQEWLNVEDAALWGLAVNGERLRLLRDNESLTRPAYIEANLRQIFEAEDFASFAVLWLILHASRFGQPDTPVIEREETDIPAALLSLTVIDPACGSGHFLLAAARRIAGRLAKARTAGLPTAADNRHALRDVVRSVLYGVDRNPMAVELARVALWIESVDPGKPLGFLDANLKVGDSLLGIFSLDALTQGIPDAAYKPLTGDDKTVASNFMKRNKRIRDKRTGMLNLSGTNRPLRAIATSFQAVRNAPEETPEDVASRHAQYTAAKNDPHLTQLEAAAQMYVAAFLTAKTKDTSLDYESSPVPTTEDVWKASEARTIHGTRYGKAIELARLARAFHWPLEFPDVFAAGGFDVVLGNPPWEVMQLSEEEYFAQHWPEVAELAGAARKRAIAELRQTNPQVFAEFEKEKRRFEASNEFARASGRFDRTARGKVNTYSLFAELFSSTVSEKGRAGIIVPTGIATDASTAPFFASLVENKRLARLVDFENRDAIFPSVHRSYKFSLLTIAHNVPLATFAFFLTDTAQLAQTERIFTLSPEQISRINPNTKTAPVFRSKSDAELTAKIYARVPVLINETLSEAGNPWQIEFRQGFFNMTSDSGLFRTARQLEEMSAEQQDTDWILRCPVPQDNVGYFSHI